MLRAMLYCTTLTFKAKITVRRLRWRARAPASGPTRTSRVNANPTAVSPAAIIILSIIESTRGAQSSRVRIYSRINLSG